MPTPVLKSHDLAEILRQAVFLQRVAAQNTTIEMRGVEQPVHQICDGRLISQALTNLLKNATEAVAARLNDESGDIQEGKILIELSQDEASTSVEIVDNGCGLPKEGRNRLTEPYMTTRTKGTGLGLAIVKKIMEDHGGNLVLDDADKSELMDAGDLTGAMVKLTIPRETLTARQVSDAEAERELSHGA